MKQNTASIGLSKQFIENKIEEAFQDLWELGVLGVKVVVQDQHLKLCTYLLSNAEIEDVSPAMKAVVEDLNDRFTVEETVIHGVVPINRISTEIAA
jgi:hypothetical protein